MSSWDDLSMAEKADVMKLAIEGGVYDLDAIRSGYNEFAKGGRIHIKPSKRGTFTAAASKHGKSVQAFASQVLAHKENYSPAMVKKANFARNASKWKHAYGGNLFEDGGKEKTQTAFTPIKNPVIPTVSKEEQEAINWMSSWYNKRRKQLHNNNADSVSVPQVLFSTFKDAVLGYPSGRLMINHDYYNKLNNMKEYSSAPLSDLKKDDPEDYKNVTSDDSVVYGYTHPKTKKVYYDYDSIEKEAKNRDKQTGFSLLGTRIHEKTHQIENVGKDGHFLLDSPQLKTLDKIIKRNPMLEKDKYLDDMSEIYARMMEFRYNHNLNPEKEYSTDEIQEMLDKEDKHKTNSYLDRYTIESLTKALNEVAQRKKDNNSFIFNDNYLT